MKRNNKETRSYVQGLRLFSKLLPKNTKNILKKNGHNYLEIIKRWNDLMESNIANSSYPKSVKINSDKKNNTLVLAVKRGNEILIEYSKKEIIDKINSFFGYCYINKIRLESVNSTVKEKRNKHHLVQFSGKFEKQIKQIKSKDIKQSFIKLLSAIKNE